MSDDNKDSKKKKWFIVPIILGAGIAAAGLLYHTGVIAGKKPEANRYITNNYNTNILVDPIIIENNGIVTIDNYLTKTPVPKDDRAKKGDDKPIVRQDDRRDLEDAVDNDQPLHLGLDLVVSGQYRGYESSIIVTVDPSIIEKGYVIKSLGRKDNGQIVYGVPYTGVDLTGSNYVFTGIIPRVDENPTLSLTAILEREETVRGAKVKRSYTDDQDLTVAAPRYFSVHDIEGAYQVKTEHRDLHLVKIFGTTLEGTVYERGGRSGLISNPSDGPVFSREYLKPGTDVLIEAYYLNDNGTLKLLDKRRF